MQEADEPGTGVRIRRARGDEDKLLLSPGAPSTLGELTALEGADTECGRPLSPGQQQHRSPGGHPGTQPGWKHWRIRVWRPGLQTWALRGQTEGRRREGPAQD